MESESYTFEVTIEATEGAFWYQLDSEMTIEQLYEKAANDGVLQTNRSVLKLIEGNVIKKNSLMDYKGEHRIEIPREQTLWEAFETWNTIKHKDETQIVPLLFNGRDKFEFVFQMNKKKPMKLKDLGFMEGEPIEFEVQESEQEEEFEFNSSEFLLENDESIMDHFEFNNKSKMMHRSYPCGSKEDAFDYISFNPTTLGVNISLPDVGTGRTVMRMDFDISENEIKYGKAFYLFGGKLIQYELEQDVLSNPENVGILGCQKPNCPNCRRLKNNKVNRRIRANFKKSVNTEELWVERIRQNNFEDYMNDLCQCDFKDNIITAEEVVAFIQEQENNSQKVMRKTQPIGNISNCYESEEENINSNVNTFLQGFNHAHMMAQGRGVGQGGRRDQPQRVFVVRNGGGNQFATMSPPF